MLANILNNTVSLIKAHILLNTIFSVTFMIHNEQRNSSEVLELKLYDERVPKLSQWAECVILDTLSLNFTVGVEIT